MKIYVVPRSFVKQFNVKSSFFKDNNFISIGEFEGGEGVSANGDNILKLVFEDISDREDGILFTEDQAKQIKEFVDRIDKEKALFVNCQAGISRSGAVGAAINDYVNYKLNDCQKSKDWYQFFDMNTRIRPNAYVSRILKRTLELY